MNESLETTMQRICPGIKVEQVDPQSESTLAQKRNLFEAIKVVNGWVYLDDDTAQFRFFGWLYESEEIVGASSLRTYSDEGRYALTYMVHPNFSHRGIAMALATYAVEFAKTSGRIREIYAHVRPDTYSERIVKNLGFECLGPPEPSSKNLTYILRLR